VLGKHEAVVVVLEKSFVDEWCAEILRDPG
jgi:hypothetical protein